MFLSKRSTGRCTRPGKWIVLPVLVILTSALVGCSSPITSDPGTFEVDPAQQQIQQIGTVYLNATVRLNRPPQKRDELLADLKPLGPPDKTLRSKNDGEEFVIVWGVELRELKATGKDVPIVAFEKKGKNGKRYVLRGYNTVLQMDDSDLRDATFPPGYKLPF